MDPRSYSSRGREGKDESSRGLNAGQPESDVDKLAASFPLDHSYAGQAPVDITKSTQQGQQCKKGHGHFWAGIEADHK